MAEPHVITLGCRLNAFESEIIREQGRVAGLTNAVIINTCAVTAEAERQARKRAANAASELLLARGVSGRDPAGDGE